MRKTIPPDAATRPAFVAEADEASLHVTLEADGHLHRFGPDEARRIARAKLQAARPSDRPDGRVRLAPHRAPASDGRDAAAMFISSSFRTKARR